MNSITMKMQADQLIRMALQEDITRCRSACPDRG